MPDYYSGFSFSPRKTKKSSVTKNFRQALLCAVLGLVIQNSGLFSVNVWPCSPCAVSFSCNGSSSRKTSINGGGGCSPNPNLATSFAREPPDGVERVQVIHEDRFPQFHISWTSFLIRNRKVSAFFVTSNPFYRSMRLRKHCFCICSLKGTLPVEDISPFKWFSSINSSESRLQLKWFNRSETWKFSPIFGVPKNVDLIDWYANFRFFQGFIWLRKHSDILCSGEESGSHFETEFQLSVLSSSA